MYNITKCCVKNTLKFILCMKQEGMEKLRKQTGSGKVVDKIMVEETIRTIRKTEKQAQEIVDNATRDANTIRIGAIQYTDDLLANAESIIGHTLDSYTTKYDGLINSLQECYDTVRSNRAELDIPDEDGYDSQDKIG